MLGSYELFKTAIYDLSKIELNSYKERQMKRRIDALITKNGINTYKDYVNKLKSDKVAYDEFINYITINVSEFYRNSDQWRILETEILPVLFEQFGNNLKIWSAACSTGDEPYSLVMLLSEFLPLKRIKIYATDIDKQVLEKAQLGLYHEKSLRSLPTEFIDQYFVKINDRTYQISDAIRSCVEFHHHDLLKDSYPNNCDLIVCRNVLIYFTDEAKNKVYQGFNKALKKDAILFVGSTEQIIQANQLGYRSTHSFFYKKI